MLRWGGGAAVEEGADSWRRRGGRVAGEAGGRSGKVTEQDRLRLAWGVPRAPWAAGAGGAAKGLAGAKRCALWGALPRLRSRAGSGSGPRPLRVAPTLGPMPDVDALGPTAMRRRMDVLTSAERSARMARIRARDTKPEMIVRRLVHSMGARYRLHDKRLPGSPDLVFPSRRKVIFVHGCFWHRHPDPQCGRVRTPKSRREYWEPKLAGNRERDIHNQSQLAALGWQSLVVWECEISDREQLRNRIGHFLDC